MDMTDHELLGGKAAAWFPLVPRFRPPCRTLSLRIDEIRELAHSASSGTYETRLTAATEAHNKAALILSDCGLDDLAHQLCWQQFDLFNSAAPLTPKAAKYALQPLVNLGRLLIRSGLNSRAYELFQNAFDAMQNPTPTSIDGRKANLSHLVDHPDYRRELRRFLWTVLLADGTRALTRAGRWNAALRHIEQHKGIGTRMLDGRQVAILARCADRNGDGALAILDGTVLLEPWEQAVAACLRTLSLTFSDRPADSAVSIMVDSYLQLDPVTGYPLFRTRLGLCVLDLASSSGCGEQPEVAARIAADAVAAADAYVAQDVLACLLYLPNINGADKQTLTEIIESSGLHCGMMPPALLDNVMAFARLSEAQMVRLLYAKTPKRRSI